MGIVGHVVLLLLCDVYLDLVLIEVRKILLIVAIGCAVRCSAQAGSDADSAIHRLDELIVTATRTQKKSSELTMPALLVYGEQIALSGVTQLNEILEEQTGITISEDHGAGMQIQGFDPEYTMVLIDGEPMIGKNAGLIDLRRINLRNVERIEIIKGGSSCLYGSDAMAGALNIITKSPGEVLGGGVYGNVNFPSSAEVGGDLAWKMGKWGFRSFLSDRYQWGYDLLPDQEGLSVGRSHTRSAQIKAYRSTEKHAWRPSLRFYQVVNPGDVYNSGTEPFYNVGQVNDVQGSIQHTYKGNFGRTLRNKLMLGWYHANGEFGPASDKSAFEKSHFQQQFLMTESIYEVPYSARHSWLVGAGTRQDIISSVRYAEIPVFSNYYAFGQWQYRPIKNAEFISGLRWESGNWYAGRLTPKFSGRYTWSNWTVKGSYGMGYKTPDYRQLYLDFTNGAVGYSVFGTEVVANRLEQLQQQNQINRVINDVPGNNDLTPETSHSVNVGVVTRGKDFTIELNGFRNLVNQLIESYALAEKNNGQYVYSYRNQNRVLLMGGDVQLKWSPTGQWQFSAGGQYLDSRDLGTIKQINNGALFLRDPETLRTRRLSYDDYLGLFGRSPWQWNTKVAYHIQRIATWIYVRCLWRDTYPFADSNGNLVADVHDDQAPARYMWHVSSRTEYKQWALQLGVRNLLNEQSDRYLSGNPGRQWQITIQYQIQSDEK